MLATVTAPANIGYKGALIDVECDITNGLPSLVIVGLGNQAVNEARDRVRSAVRNSHLMMPPKRITLNLAPADLPKDGTAYDLSIAIAILVASKQLEPPSGYLFVGELALDGTLRPVRAALSYAQLAVERGIRKLIVPAENAKEASLIAGVTVFGAKNLMEVYGHLFGVQPLEPYDLHVPKPGKRTFYTDLSSIYGQAEAKRALEIAAAGAHNILFSGPPGTGKTMLARALTGIMPRPTLEEMIEITKLHSLAGVTHGRVITERPFRNPHHSASGSALIGGGGIPRPGEISLSHLGVLFLDELPEFRRDVLDLMREPLEEGMITIARASKTATFPARFLLVAAKNPCPCGFAGDSVKTCQCTQATIFRYNRKVSGPFMDRIDLNIGVNRVDPSKIGASSGESSEIVLNRVQAGVEFANARGQSDFNGRLDNVELQKFVRLSQNSKRILHAAVNSMSLSTRAHLKVLKVARTIADIEQSESVNEKHVAEAISYRIKS